MGRWADDNAPGRTQDDGPNTGATTYSPSTTPAGTAVPRGTPPVSTSGPVATVPHQIFPPGYDANHPPPYPINLDGTPTQNPGESPNYALTSPLPTFTKGMTDDQVRAAANMYITQGGAKNIDNGDYWVQKYHEFGGNDPAYFQTQLQNAIAGQPGYNGKYGAAPPSGNGQNGANGANLPGWMVQPWTKEFSYDKFTAPTDVTEQNDPGFQFRQQQGQQAIERSASSRGVLGGGGTLKDLENYSQGLASQEYQNVWNRAFTDWGTGYNNALSQYQMSRDQFFANQDRPFNKNQAIAGLGQTSATALGSQGTQFVNTAAGLYTGIGNASAAGTVGAANAYGNALSNIGNNALAQQYFSSFTH
jgi:hypothetical protein